MTWKIELAALAITAASVGGYLYKTNPFETAPVEYHAAFTEADYHAFDRDFALAGDVCEVGLKESSVCLSDFDMKKLIVPGEAFPSDVPPLGAGMRVLLALDVKEAHLQTIQYGQTLILMDRGTRQVEDVLYLNAASYADARTPELNGGSVAMAAN